MARYLLLSLFFVLTTTIGFAQTAVGGKVTDPSNGEELINATIQLFKGGVFVQGAVTDFNGNYRINVDPGTYDVVCSYLGFADKRINGVIMKANQTTSLDIEMGEQALTLGEVIVTEYKVPLIDKDNTTSGGIITSKDIRALPTKNISALASTTAGLSQVDEGDAVTVRGSRSDATDYYLDGIRISSSQLPPETEIEQLQVITGGIQAQYGDVTGGIISLTSKGPSSKFSGGLELETSEYLDAFGYNQINANISGPILKNKKGQSILGFRLSSRYRYQKDDDPPAVPIYQIKDEKLAELQANPLFARGPASVPQAENLTNDDVNVLDFRPNEQNKRLDITTKIDARLTDNIDISLTGTFADTRNRFTPGNAAGRPVWRVLNSHNNPEAADRRYRANFRFRHRLGNNNAAAATEEGAPKKASIIQNAEYTLQVGFEKGLLDREDIRHKDNLFNYGYVGSFDRIWTPAVGSTEYTGSAFFNEQNIFIPQIENGIFAGGEVLNENEGVGHVSNTATVVGFTPSNINQTIANYNLIAEETGDFSAINGNFNQNGDVGGIWQDMHTNVGQVFNQNRKSNNDLYTFSATSSFDLLPGGSEKGRHSLQFGILYEQRYNRNWQINPRALWTLARQEANIHILGVDTSSVVGTFEADLLTFPDFLPITGQIPEHPTLIDDTVEGLFYRRVRDVTGQSLNEYVNVDAIAPENLTLDLFSARELIDDVRIGIDYYGYDYLGNQLSNDVTFDDFFTTRDADGRRTFPVAPFKPNYFAAYVQDKFTFNDITFRIGVRVDRYDANTKVLRDPYSVAPIMTAGDFFDEFGGERPGTIGDDFRVYVDGDGSKNIQAFRDGDTWYFANGTQANNGIDVFPGGLAFPKFVEGVADIQSEDFNPTTSFEDYEPQINWMPRLAFSFPISDDANFFAHYDILVQRPPSGTIATALDYFNFSRTPPRNNPNLRPEKTIDYEVGFRQKLTNSSAIKVAAYYKELRDMIQSRIYTFVAEVNNYTSFGNLDFGTVKGFTFQYDLRRTGNLSANINYTLQFADGTGSDARSQETLLARGNIRTLIPLNFDERHRIVSTLDYRFTSGSKYNGPKWFGKDIFANAGINFQTIAVSGRPFTKNEIPLRFGGEQFEGAINGARKPWTFTINMRVDKDFTLSKSENFPLNLNVYLRISNLLDTRNVVDVYSASGSAEDDGFLLSTQGIAAVEAASNRNEQAFLASYQWALANPNFFSLPRRIFLGAIFEF
ncbi:MAG: carboxypeptidase regulatory-like domain-containing protein [Bacteroidota bacterium]